MACRRGAGGTTNPDLEEGLVDAAALVKRMGLDVLQQVLEGLGLGGAVLLQDVLERHDHVRVRHGAEGRGLGEVGQGAAGGRAAEGPAGRSERGWRAEARPAAFALLAALHGGGFAGGSGERCGCDVVAGAAAQREGSVLELELELEAGAGGGRR